MTDLIVMTKGGESIAVHPTCVADHQRLGWVVSAVQAPPDAPKPKRKKPD